MARSESEDGVLTGTESDEPTQAEEEEEEEEEPLRFGATSTVPPFQTSGSLLIPRVREDEVEPERSLRLLNLDTSWLHPPEPEQKATQHSRDLAAETEAWRTDDTKMHQHLLQLENEIEEKHLAWKQAAGLCVPVEELQPTNGDPARANQIQDEIQDKLQQIAALHRERAEFRRRVAEGWRKDNTAAAQAALAQRSSAWRHAVTDASRKHRDVAACIAEQTSKELDIALRAWSTPEAAEQRLGTKPCDSLRMFLASLNLEGYTEAFEAHSVSTVSLQMLKRADLQKLLCKIGLNTDQDHDAIWRGLHPGESTRDDIRAAFEAGVEPDEYGAVSGALDLRGKINGSKAALLLGAVLSKLPAPLPYTTLDLGRCEISAPALREISLGMRQAFSGVSTDGSGRPKFGRLRVVDLHGVKFCPPERRPGATVDGDTVPLSTRTLAINHEQVCADCCAALAVGLPDSLEELYIVSCLSYRPP